MDNNAREKKSERRMQDDTRNGNDFDESIVRHMSETGVVVESGIVIARGTSA